MKILFPVLFIFFYMKRMDKTFFQGSHNKYISLEIILCLDNFNTCSSQIVKKRKNPFEVPPSSVFLCHENQHAKN